MARKAVGPPVPSALKQEVRQVRSHSLPTNHSALPAAVAAERRQPVAAAELQLVAVVVVAAGLEQAAAVRLVDRSPRYPQSSPLFGCLLVQCCAATPRSPDNFR